MPIRQRTNLRTKSVARRPAARSSLRVGNIALAGVFAGAALLGACDMSVGQSTSSLVTVTAVPNPPLDPRCGLDAVIVLDASSSVRNYNNPPDANGAVDLIAGAGNAFLGAFADTNSRVAVVSYNADPRLQLDLTAVTTDSLAAGGAHGIAMGDPGGPQGPMSPTTGYSEHARNGSGTNWEAGLVYAQNVLENNGRADVPKLVIHVTDGRPTRHLTPDGTVTDEGGMAVHVAEAAEVADQLKASGVHIFAVGVGRAPQFSEELQATSGPDVFDQTQPGDAFDVVNDDVILAADFDQLEELLRGVADQICGASLTITKLSSTPEAPNSFAPAEGWAFSASVDAAAGGYNWTLPDAAPATEKTAISDAEGNADFQWQIFDDAAWGAGTVTVTESQQSGYAMQNRALCVRTRAGAVDFFFVNVSLPAGSFDVELQAGDDVNCVVRNRADPNATVPADIEVVKTASTNLLPEEGGDVTFTFTVTESTGNGSVELHTLTDSIYGDLNGQGDCSVPQTLAPSGSYTCSFTTTLTGFNAGFTETNVVTAEGTDENGVEVSDTDDETVVIGDNPPDMHMCKVINPEEAPASGGYIELLVYIFNDSTWSDRITIQSVTDERFGDLLDPANPLVADGYCTAGLDPGGSYMCAYTVFFAGGTPGDVYYDTATVVATDDEGNYVSSSYETELRVVAD
ncbi:vWA domain-containing protein [Haliangium ochraceum]|uniref:von Willebrand factor type A n=1 Tax=Haliangium ochraceum (strain DSM 14365 / JCM 11303 / SMP-2) TaxID=502025 RepID=D0LZS0_HALO1|nr:vWA domain-containing protein [Haliangium ochraceum]ACY18049.1 von Willebrand factor type A [Haliangium ochraceum DSM 14365]